MAQPVFKNEPVERVPLTDEVKILDALLEEVVALARDVQQLEAPEMPAAAPQSIPNFSRVLQTSGRWMLSSDMIALFAAFITGGLIARSAHFFLVNGTFQELWGLNTLQQFAVYAVIGLTSLFWFDTKGHYRQRLPYWEMVGHILTVAFIGIIGGGFIQFLAKDASSSRLWVCFSWCLFPVLLFVGRGLTRHMLSQRKLWQIPALVIGRGPTAQATLNALQREPEMGFTFVDHISPASLDDAMKPHEWKYLLLKHNACHIFLALEGSEMERHAPALKSLVRARVPCSIMPPWLGLPSSTLSPHHFMMHDILMLHDTNRLQLPLPRFLKRGFDIIVAGALLTFLLPVFATIALLVRRDGAPAFFSQDRVGRNGKLFLCYKFRSMRSDAEQALKQYLENDPEAAAEWKQFQKLKNDVRVTAFGRFIRKTSMDELPQLINVLTGDMSLVGPRPILPGQEALYADDFSFYESVRPGISGPWQVSGRNRLTFKERVALESWYARNWSLWMDVVILLKTIPTLLKKGQAF